MKGLLAPVVEKFPVYLVEVGLHVRAVTAIEDIQLLLCVYPAHKSTGSSSARGNRPGNAELTLLCKVSNCNGNINAMLTPDQSSMYDRVNTECSRASKVFTNHQLAKQNGCMECFAEVSMLTWSWC